MYQAARLPSRRLMTIDQAVRAREWPDGPTPARRLEVDLRTMRRDITFLREQLGAPIEYDPARKGYHDTETFRSPALPPFGGGRLGPARPRRAADEAVGGNAVRVGLTASDRQAGHNAPDGVTVRLDATADVLAVLPAARPYFDPESFYALATAVVCRRRVEMVSRTAAPDETTGRVFDPQEQAGIRFLIQRR